MFRKADFVSANVQPTFNSQSKVESILGALLSLSIMVIGAFGFYYFGKEVYEKKKPDAKMSSEMIEISQINIDRILPVLMLRKSTVNISLNPSIQRAIKLYAVYLEVFADEQKKATVKRHFIPISLCEERFLSDDVILILKQINLDFRQFLCFDKLSSELPKDKEIVITNVAGLRTFE